MNLGVDQPLHRTSKIVLLPDVDNYATYKSGLTLWLGKPDEAVLKRMWWLGGVERRKVRRQSQNPSLNQVGFTLVNLLEKMVQSKSTSVALHVM